MADGSEVPIARRRLLGATPATALGIVTLALPAAAVAASAEGAGVGLQTLQVLTVDDTVTVEAGHDITLRLRLLRPDGTLFTGAATVSTTVTLDDGTSGGSHPTGLRIDGATVSAGSPTVTRALTADDGGTLDVSIDVPAAGTYLIRFETTPTALTNPGGVTLSVTLP